MAMRPTTIAGVNLRLGGGSGSDKPDVCAESGGVAPGETPPPGSRPGVRAGSGSGGWAVIRPSHTPSRCAYTSARTNAQQLHLRQALRQFVDEFGQGDPPVPGYRRAIALNRKRVLPVDGHECLK